MPSPDAKDPSVMLERAVAQLMEHFESVRIFATRMERGEDGPEAYAYNSGGGNNYATQGQVREWLVMQDHRARVHIERQDAGREDD